MTRIGKTGQASGAYSRIQSRTRVATSDKVERPPAVEAIVPAKLPPHVRDAFDALLAETDDLRRTLNLARRRIEELEKLVEADELTSVANRRGLIRDLGRTLSEVERHGLSAALIFVDVDGLKRVNDTYGHVGGDAALVHVGEILRAHVREADSVARLGGDEFVLVLGHVDAAQVQLKTAELMQAVRATPVALHGGEFTVGISAGFQMLEAGTDAATALAAADRAMYAQKMAKRKGGGGKAP